MPNDYSETRQERTWEEDTAEHESWGDEEGQATVSPLCSSPSVERTRHRRLHRRRHRGMTYADPSTDAGCFHDILHTSVNCIHLYHVVTGLTLLGYSIAIFLNHHSSQQQQYWHTLPTILTICSILLLLAGSTGLHGLHSPICRRYGLKISAYIGITMTIWDSALLIFFLIRRHSFLQFLRSGEAQFYLTEHEIDAFDRNSTVLILVVLAFALVEILRFYMLRRLRSDLLAQDDAKLNLQRRNDARRRILDQRRWKRSARSGGHPTQDYDDRIESLLPLLAEDNNEKDNYDDGGLGAKEPAIMGHEEYHSGDTETGNANGHNNANIDHASSSWWEDPVNCSTADDRQVVSKSKQTRKTSSWLLNAWRSPKKDATNKNNIRNYHEAGNSDDDSKAEEGLSSGDDFAPIDEDLSMGSIEWTNDCNNTAQPQTGDGTGTGPLSGDNEPDLSWAQDN